MPMPPRSSQRAIDACPANAEPSRNIGRTELLLVPKLVDDRGIDFRLSPLIDTARLRCGISFGLAFLPQVGLELGEHPKHVEEGLTGSGARVDRLFSRAQRYSFFLQLVDDVLQILQ
jgi:hypothetical protein